MWVVIFLFIFVVLPLFCLTLGIMQFIKYRKTKNKTYLAFAILLSLILIIVAGVGSFIYHNNGYYDCGGNYHFSLYRVEVDCWDPDCINIEVQATRVTNVSNDYTVTLTRTPGEGMIGGVLLLFTNVTETPYFTNYVPGDFKIGETKTVTVNNVTLPNPNKVSVVIYFLAEDGTKRLCDNAYMYKFA
jgi:hypothetical protein